MPIRPENRARYPKNWKEISQRVRDRAGNQCEFCKVRDRYWVVRTTDGRVLQETDRVEVAVQLIRSGERVVQIVLTVAHMDHHPENCADENLKALCQKCHNKYDAEHRTKSRKTNAVKDAESSGQMKLI